MGPRFESGQPHIIFIMTEVKKSAGSAKRLGVRYGRTTRQKIGDIEKVLRSKQKCPYCAKNKVKRIAAGIWQCRGCNNKFSGAAYAIKKEEKAEVEQNG